jgi:hypothetical protein
MIDNSIFTRPEIEYTYEEVIQRGQEAELMLKSPVLRDALREAEYDLAQQMLEATEPSGTWAAKSAILGLGAVERALRAIVSDGEQTKNVLAAKRK